MSGKRIYPDVGQEATGKEVVATRRPPSEQYDPQVEELAQKYERAATLAATVLATTAAGVITPKALDLARSALTQLFEALLAASAAWIGLNLPVIYRRGVEDAVRVIEGPSQDELRRQVDEAMRNPAHQEAMNTLAETLRDDLQSAINGMNRDANTELSEIRQRNVRRALVQGSPLSQVEELAREIERVGFTDKAGRKWDAEVYSRMLLRTRVAEILNIGHINRTLEMGSVYVRVFDGVDHDDECRRVNGQTWHVSHAIREPLCHPNGRRSYAGLPPDYSGPVDREAA